MKTNKCILFLLLLSTMTLLKACSSDRHSNVDQERIMASINMEEAYDADTREMAKMDFAEDEATTTMRFVPPTPTIEQQMINFVSTKAASAENDGDKKFIRTAKLTLKVADVISATHAIENIIIAQKGFIINSFALNEDLYSRTTRVSKDSILVEAYTKPSANLEVRVHYTHLDQVLREIAPLALSISRREVNAREVTFVILSDKLEQIREKDKSQRIKNISGNNKGHKLEDLLNAEEAIDDARSRANYSYITEMEREDEVKYSTITIILEQEKLLTTSMHANPIVVKEYTPNFLARTGTAIADGFEISVELIIIFARLWPLWVVIGAIVWLVLFYKRRKKRKAEQQ